MKIQNFFFSLIAFLFLVGNSSLSGFGQSTFDQGTFIVSVEGREVGTEEFSINQSGSGDSAEVIVTGRIRVRLPEGTLELTPRLLVRGAELTPVSYQVDVGGSSPQRILGTLGKGRFSAKIVTGSGEQLREYVASEGAVVLDEGVAHHYFFISSRTHSGKVPVIVPRENRQVMATVTSRGKETITFGSKDISLIHLVVQPQGSDERHVWVDDKNRVYKVEIPGRSYKAQRTELPR